jgi:hypothetical protein
VRGNHGRPQPHPAPEPPPAEPGRGKDEAGLGSQSSPSPPQGVPSCSLSRPCPFPHPCSLSPDPGPAPPLAPRSQKALERQLSLRQEGVLKSQEGKTVRLNPRPSPRGRAGAGPGLTSPGNRGHSCSAPPGGTRSGYLKNNNNTKKTFPVWCF